MTSSSDKTADGEIKVLKTGSLIWRIGTPLRLYFFFKMIDPVLNILLTVLFGMPKAFASHAGLGASPIPTLG